MLPRAVLPALLIALAGCAEPADEAAPAPEAAAPAPDNALPEAVAPADAAPHAHDYWAGRERVTLLDAAFEVSPDEAVEWGLLSTLVLGDPFFGGFEVQPPEGALVYEGAGSLEITATWTDPGVTGLRFLHRHAGSPDIQPWTSAPNSEPVVLSLTPEMTDMPHAQASRWRFLFAAEGTPALAVGAFHLRMEVVKARDVAVWPAHPDLWKGASELRVADAEGAYRGMDGPLGALDRDPWDTPADAVPAQSPVPMGTTELVVTAEILGEPSPAVGRLSLHVRTAADLEFDFDPAPAGNASEDGRTWTWRLPVEMTQTDSPYATQGTWAFRVFADPDLPTEPLPCDGACHPGEVRYRLSAVALRGDPEPTTTSPQG